MIKKSISLFLLILSFNMTLAYALSIVEKDECGDKYFNELVKEKFGIDIPNLPIDNRTEIIQDLHRKLNLYGEYQNICDLIFNREECNGCFKLQNKKEKLNRFYKSAIAIGTILILLIIPIAIIYLIIKHFRKDIISRKTNFRKLIIYLTILIILWLLVFLFIGSRLLFYPHYL